MTVGLFFFGLLLTGCETKLVERDSADSVPLALRVSAHPDSLLTLPDWLDFSVVSKSGQGPSGTLIRWNLLGSPGNNYTAYTYDQQSRLVSTCEHTSYGYDQLRLAHYEDGYLAQVYTGIDYSGQASSPKKVGTIGSISKYTYDAQHRLGQVLVYENVGGTFKLNQTIQYNYDTAGQLQQTRHTTGLAFSSVGGYPVEVRYWANGDIYQLETYPPNQPPIKSTNRLFYNQVVNPRSRLHLWPQNVLTQHYLIGSGVTSLDRETDQYQYGYDAQGRLSSVQQRSVHEYNGWTDWSYKEEFVYAK
ncbi:hypothetical protein GCM10028819_24640 [Spirosoma humi]